jgi:hypothetical protein
VADDLLNRDYYGPDFSMRRARHFDRSIDIARPAENIASTFTIGSLKGTE